MEGDNEHSRQEENVKREQVDPHWRLLRSIGQLLEATAGGWGLHGEVCSSMDVLRLYKSVFRLLQACDVSRFLVTERHS